MGRKLRMGMVGGGRDAFIGAVHRMAAIMDGEIELVCGALSSNPDKARLSGEDLYLDPSRVYTSYEEMIAGEKALPAEKRMDFVSIVTPNHLHFGPAKMAMENGFHVVLDKPATFTLAEAKELKKLIDQTGALFCLTHTYTGYPMVKEARQILASGKLGKIRKVYVEYPQGWLTNFREGSNYKQAAWRTDPKRSGISGCMGDIGTHAFNMAEYVSGLSVTAICADMNIVVPGRLLDDDGAVLLKFNDGVSGFLFATQIAAGEENNVKVRVYGEKGGLEWKQEDANSLLVKWLDEPTQILRAGNPYLSSYARAGTRTPAGHPEGYLEAFANIYRNFAFTLRARLEGKTPTPEWLDFPGIDAGIRGMAFIENVVKSAASDMKWMPFEE
ncbi:Gfo/Idh/MocA family protein [Flavihumibacter fluvii]|uniref:Gfo/Idh/MocA family protein n=1 Tax=Flavihumibacter fluvii TaxID=2838157 RepID=UPI001BDE7824|nr:Gfo/Idh/MocA family oxidoreductase [Flavihumibacter fluvii]ULQ54536.1 Gfo/Idh/MocA family oxidoreductase [Flavihumibacter fluvii]